jgi:hypothetical protein
MNKKILIRILTVSVQVFFKIRRMYVHPGHDNVCHNYKILGVIKCITCLAVKLLGGGYSSLAAYGSLCL